jgi:hypothetical protein
MDAAPADAEYLLKFLDGRSGLPERPRLLGPLSEESSVLLFVYAEPLGDGLRFPEKADFGFRALNC